MSFLLIFPAAAAGGFAGSLLSKTRIPTWLAFALGVAAIFVHMALVRMLPFSGSAPEALIVLSAAITAVWPSLVVFRIQEPGNEDLRFASGFFWLFTMLISAMSLCERFNYAEGLAWRCDGCIAECRHSSNHNAPVVVVGGDSFENVDAALWAKAVPGRRLVKVSGSAWATIDGERVRMVRKSLWDD